MNTKFSKEEMTQMCQILKRHGTDCRTLEDMLQMLNSGMSNDAKSTYKHVRLLKEFGILEDKDLQCHKCVKKIIIHHADTCEEYKERLKSDNYFFPCLDSHYDYSKVEPAVWMVDSHRVYVDEERAAYDEWENGNKENVASYRDEVDGKEVDIRTFTHEGRTIWLEKTFPDVDEEIRFNPWMGFLCDKHIGSMKKYSNKIIGYINEEGN